MKHLIYILIIFPILIFGQNTSDNISQKEEVSKTIDVSKKSVVSTSISKSFSANVISAYAIQSQQLIADFYSYLALYNQSESTEFHNEIDKAIQQLYFSNSVLIEDFIYGTNKKITLLQLLKYCKENKFIVSVTNVQNTAVTANNFDMKYRLLITNKSETKEYTITQKVYLFPVQKQFGTINKTVWELKLGEF
jgi:hypothetical protein